jgi:hypothetical protein
MDNLRKSLHSKVHGWIIRMEFNLHSSSTVSIDDVIINHYFLKTFNFIEHRKADSVDTAEFICFDNYGEEIKVKSFLDLQAAFHENLSQLR